MKDASIPVVWTLFFGDQARTLTAVLCPGEENESHLLTLCQPRRPRSVIGGPREETLIQSQHTSSCHTSALSYTSLRWIYST